MSQLRPPATIRTRLLSVVLLASVIILAALVMAFNVVLRATLDDDATSVAQARATAVLTTLETTGGHVGVGEAPDDAAVDARVWVFDGARLIEAPQPSAPALDRAAGVAAVDAPGVSDAAGTLRLVSVPVAVGGLRIGAVVAGVPLAPYQATTRTALVGSIVLALALLAAITLLAAWTLRRALQPVHEMTLLAAEWSERDPDRRFEQGPSRDEVTELAATLDTLLDRLAASLRREQRFSAELAHELRTPLARISAECELALRDRSTVADQDAVLVAIARSADTMRRTIDVLVAAARHGAGHQRGVADIAGVLDALARRMSVTLDQRGIALSVVIETPMRIALEADLAERIIEPVLDNAVRYAATQVMLSASIDGAAVVILVEDDGPGIDPADRGRIFDPGVRGVTARGDGAGLGLALTRRLVGDVAGGIELDGSSGRTRFTIRVPRA